MTLIPKNWSQFQHYKGRRPPWIKLHRALLDDYAFHTLPAASRALAPCLWLLASEYDGGNITASPTEIAFRLRMFETEFLDALNPLVTSGFFSDASGVLAARKQHARPEREKREREREKVPPSGAPVEMKNFASSVGWPADYRQQFWNKYPHKVGKAAALAKLERAAKTGRVTFENLMAGLDRYVRKTDDRPWCNPATWIHQDRWLDQPAAPAERNGAHDGQRHGRRIFGAVADDLIKQFEANDAANRETDLRNAAGENVVRRLPPRQPA